jgi:outer membrane protein OmpA-like peptidoglycan-associated protein
VFAASSYFDIYTSLSGFGLGGYNGSDEKGGIGTFRGGIQGRLPLPATSPVYLGAKFSIIGGTSSNQINTNATDGYNYFETRTGYDFEFLLLQSLCLGKNGRGFKLHLNEGGVMTLQESKDHLLILGGGFLIMPHPVFGIGVEMNSRTSWSDVRFKTDPLWISPLLKFQTPAHLSFTIGSDISLSQDRSNSSRALEPFRLFASAGLSFDIMAAKRKAILEKQKQEQAERDQEHSRANQLQAKADSIALKAHNDSLIFVQLREQEKLRADSIAKKAQEDSIKLVEVKKSLEEEKSKRTDAEKQLLSTGLLLLDAVYFESGKSDISINSEPYLIIIGKMLLKYPKLKIEIAGHTDNVGSVSKNMSLSQARAEAVTYFLSKAAPELTNRLTARGYGPTRPKSSNSYAEGRKVNRRVELQVLNKEALAEYNK